MNTLTVKFERCMSASIARTATVVAWREYHDMDGLVGAEMPEHGAGAVIARSTNSRLGCVLDESHQSPYHAQTQSNCAHELIDSEVLEASSVDFYSVGVTHSLL